MTEQAALHLEIADAMAEVAASLRAPMELEETLGVITRVAAETIPGIVEASISITTKDGQIETLAPTGPRVTRADHLQYELGEGPCLDAAIEEPIVAVNDLAADPRWPDFGPKAAALGLRFAGCVPVPGRAARAGRAQPLRAGAELDRPGLDPPG